MKQKVFSTENSNLTLLYFYIPFLIIVEKAHWKRYISYKCVKRKEKHNKIYKKTVKGDAKEKKIGLQILYIQHIKPLNCILPQGPATLYVSNFNFKFAM